MSVRTLVGLWFLLAIGNVLGAGLLDAGTAFLLWSVAASFLWGPTRRLLDLGTWSRVVAVVFVAGVVLIFILMIRRVVISVPPLPQRPVTSRWWLAIPPFVAALAIAGSGRRAAQSKGHSDAPAA